MSQTLTGLNNHTWVCFSCRTAARRQAGIENVRCNQCAQPCEWLGTKIPVPPKTNHKAWDQLRTAYYESRRQRLQCEQESKVRCIHELEQEIDRLEALPTNPGRTAAIRTLRKRLATVSVSQEGQFK